MSDNLTIAIETSGRSGSAAVGRGDELIAQADFSGFMRHSQELFAVLELLLEKAVARADEIENVYITVGPGSFTGLRIAVTAAKMFSFARHTALVAVDTMDVIAENASRYMLETGDDLDCIMTILDAKKNLFYAAVFDRADSGWKKSLGTDIFRAEELLDWLESNKKNHVVLLGEGLVYYADRFDTPFTHLLDESYWPATAAGLYRVGRRMAAQGLFADPMTLVPIYLRKPDAVVKTGK